MTDNEKIDFGTKETGMYVPEGFFAQFQKDLDKEINMKMHRKLILQRWSIAAGICVVLALTPFIWNATSSQPEPQQNIAEVQDIQNDENAAEDVLVSSVSDYDIYEYYFADL